MVHAAREMRLAARRQDLCLPDPVLQADASIETQGLAEAFDVACRETRQILEAANAELLETPLQHRIDAQDAGQVVARADATLFDFRRSARA